MSKSQAISIGKQCLTIKELDTLVSPAKEVASIAPSTRLSQWKGPFDGKINSIFRLNYGTGEAEKKLIFRARISEAFRYEAIVKEKLLFPILDGTLDLQSGARVKDAVDEIVRAKAGNHVFAEDKPPIIPLQNLYLFDETKARIPYMFSVMDFLPGISVYDFLEEHQVKGKEAQELPADIVLILDSVFMEAGEALGKLHAIEFPGFYKTITDIGDKSKLVNFKSLFEAKIKDRMAKVSKYEMIQEFLPVLKKYFDDNIDLLTDDEVPVLYHNDFQPQNFIMLPDEGHVNGFIDFDNWQISIKEDDLVKMQYWGLRGLDARFEESFMKGYEKIQHLPADFQARVELLKMCWFLLVIDFEMDKIMKNELNETVDNRFPAVQVYIDEIKKILEI